MSKELMIELFGYLGSFLVLVSFLTTSVVKLRIINTVGSVIFMIYAIIIKSYPTAVMNGALVLINLHFLYKMSRVDKEYEVLTTTKDEPIFEYFMRYYNSDISKYFDNTDLSSFNKIYMPVCQGEVTGITAGDIKGDEFYLYFDYTTAEYRDFSIGTIVFKKIKEDGVKKVIYTGPRKGFEDYFKKFNFVLENDEYIKIL